MILDLDIINGIVNLVLIIAVTVFGGKYARTKQLFGQTSNKADTFTKLLKKIVQALDDDRLTKDELNGIVRTAKELVKNEPNT